MRRLMLLRHAKSDWPAGIDDHERPLAQKGRDAGPLMGKYMTDDGLLPDLAIVSTARRARETWELVGRAFGTKIAQRSEPRIYEASANAILAVIKETDPDVRTLLLVGHNPGFQELALRLAVTAGKSDRARLERKFSTAGLAVIDLDIDDWREISSAHGRLERYETPKTLAEDSAFIERNARI